MNKLYFLLIFLLLPFQSSNAQLAFEHTFEDRTSYIYIMHIPEIEQSGMVVMQEKGVRCATLPITPVTIQSDTIVRRGNNWGIERVDEDEVRFFFPTGDDKITSVVYHKIEEEENIPFEKCVGKKRDI